MFNLIQVLYSEEVKKIWDWGYLDDGGADNGNKKPYLHDCHADKDSFLCAWWEPDYPSVHIIMHSLFHMQHVFFEYMCPLLFRVISIHFRVFGSF